MESIVYCSCGEKSRTIDSTEKIVIPKQPCVPPEKKSEQWRTIDLKNASPLSRCGNRCHFSCKKNICTQCPFIQRLGPITQITLGRNVCTHFEWVDIMSLDLMSKSRIMIRCFPAPAKITIWFGKNLRLKCELCTETEISRGLCFMELMELPKPFTSSKNCCQDRSSHSKTLI